ncbi:hypothetical protein AB0H65_14125 [Streptomyces griseoaurantiacus]|uniref:hypothetical protein n=1 Tax=Streptomyces griseoaurantiacus TaxID=68213 RepID=UPI0034616DFA
MTRTAVRPWRGVGAALGGSLLLVAGASACDTGKSETRSYVSVPDLFYLRPYGVKAPSDARTTPFHVRAKDATTPSPHGRYDHRLTVDASDAGGAVRLKIVGMSHSGPRCSGTDRRVVCEVEGEYDSWSALDRVYPVAAKGSEPGEGGVVRFTFTTEDGEKHTARSRVVVGGPAVRLRKAGPYEKVAPGAEITSDLVVRNTGQLPVRGLGVQLSGGELELRRAYSNCRYPEPYKGQVAVCELPDVRIEPGETVTLGPELRLRASRTRMDGSFTRAVWPLDIGPDKYATVPEGGEKGEGPPLEVVSTSRKGGGTFAAGSVATTVLLDTTSDFRVEEVRTRVGKGRVVHLTVHDDGPGDPGHSRWLVFTPPPGAVVTEQPMDEIDEDAFDPHCRRDGADYMCDVGNLPPGRSRTFDFTLDLDRAGEGRVAVKERDPSVDRHDPRPANDSAKVVVAP